MSNENPTSNRVPAGVSTGGQFAASSRAESGVALSDDGAVETFDMLWCENCSEGFEEGDATRLYECGECGSVSAERRCDSCNKFKSRSEDPGCPHCEEPVSETTVEMVRDHDSTLIRAEDYDPDATKAERDEQARVAEAAKSEADRLARLVAKQANSAEGTAAAIAPGTVLVNPDDDSRFPVEAEVLSTRHVETPDGPVIIFKAYDHRLKTVVRRAGDPVAVMAHVEEYPTEGQGPDGRRLSASDFSGARYVEGFNEHLKSVSSSSNAIDVTLGPLPRDGGTLPALALVLGRRNHKGNFGGMVNVIGVWDDPDEAAAALDEMDRAADAFAAHLSEHPPVAEDEDDSWDKANRIPGWHAVQAKEVDWVSFDPQRTITMQVGISDWDRDLGAVMKIDAPDGLNVALDDPAVLKAAAAEARKHLDRLTGIPERPDVVDDKV